jgi:hypothetical protein
MARLSVPRSFQQAVVEMGAVARDPLLALWTLHVFLFPIYVFNSGLPQPSDLMIVLLLPLALSRWNGRLYKEAIVPLKRLLVFVAWVIIINYTWMLLLGKFGLNGKDAFLMVPSYYLFDTATFFVVLLLYQRYGRRFLWLTFHVVLATTLFQTFFSMVYKTSHGGRGIVLFNNPNQLGFYALLSASLLALGRRRLGISPLKTGIGVTASIYLSLLSASKAALLGCGVLLIVSLLNNPRAVILAFAAMIGAAFVGGPITEAVNRTMTRLEAPDRYEEYSFFEMRGYDRITKHSEYLLLGAGEGGLSRFEDTSVIGDHELHSSAGTLIFSYGVVGTLMFMSFLYSIVRGAKFRVWLLLLPAMAYSMAHQGLRFTMLWVVLAVFIALKHEKQAVPAEPPLPPRRRRRLLFLGAR